MRIPSRFPRRAQVKRLSVGVGSGTVGAQPAGRSCIRWLERASLAGGSGMPRWWWTTRRDRRWSVT